MLTNQMLFIAYSCVIIAHVKLHSKIVIILGVFEIANQLLTCH